MDAVTLDINCDLGESFGTWTLGDDEAVLPRVSSANVACGFHAGDPGVMRRTVELCVAHGVAVGAHPGFPDLLGFGRRRMALEPEEAADYITYQAGALRAFADAAGAPLHHVKPHGAFFALLRDDPSLADAAADAVAACGPGVLAYWPGRAAGVAYCAALQARGVDVVEELYPDLEYDPEGHLIIEPRKRWTDPAAVTTRVERWIADRTVLAVDGTVLDFPEARSLCVHGDGPNAEEVARAAREAIEASGGRVAAPVAA